mgnify:CR=1 FL=1
MKSERNWGRLGMKYDENSLYDIKSSMEGKRFSLFDLAIWKNGLAFKKINFSETGVPVIKISELKNGISGTTAYTQQKFPETVHLNKGDLLFSWSGNPQTSIDVFRFNLEEGWLNQHIFKVTPDENVVDGNYFYFLMKNLKPHFTQIATNKQTTGLGHVTISDIKRMSVIIPSIDLQRKIVSYIKPIDDKIVLNNEINNNLEQQAQAIFDNMFPDISNGYCTIGDYITPKRGKSLLSKNAIFGDIPVIAGGLEPSTYHNVANTQSPILTISASGANAGYVSLWNVPVWSSDSSFIDSSMTDDVYFWYVLLKKRQKEIFDAQTGSAQPHIYPKHIASMSIPSLDIEEVHSYTSIVTPIFEMIGQHNEENTILASTRDSLLPKLMSGELDVSNIDL